MEAHDVENYVSEAARMARSGGRVFLTAFVEDGVPDVSVNPIGYVSYDCSVPLCVVRYSKDWLFSMFDRHGLSVNDFRYHDSMFPKQSEIYLVRT